MIQKKSCNRMRIFKNNAKFALSVTFTTAVVCSVWHKHYYKLSDCMLP